MTEYFVDRGGIRTIPDPGGPRTRPQEARDLHRWFVNQSLQEAWFDTYEMSGRIEINGAAIRWRGEEVSFSYDGRTFDHRDPDDRRDVASLMEDLARAAEEFEGLVLALDNRDTDPAL